MNCALCKEKFQIGDMIAFWLQRPVMVPWYAPWRYLWERKFAHNTCWRASDRATGYDVVELHVGKLVEKIREVEDA